MAHHIAGHCCNQVWWCQRHGQGKGIAVQKLLDPSKAANVDKHDSQTDNTRACIDGLESSPSGAGVPGGGRNDYLIITSAMWSEVDTMPRAIDFYEMTSNYIVSPFISS